MNLIDPDGRDCIYPGGTVVSGDCYSTDDPGVYINCDGCVDQGSGHFNDNGDLIGYSVNGQLYVYAGNATGVPFSNFAPNNGLPTPSLIKATIPGTNYCGPGGSGTPTTRVDGACAAHDLCYQNAGAKWYNNVFGTGGAGMQSNIQSCNAQLCGSLQRILIWPTSQEAGQATLVGAAFGCTP